MAISSAAVWEVRETGSDTNGGFFNGASGGTDYSQRDTPVLSRADFVLDGSASISSAVGGFTAALVGNGIDLGGAKHEIVGCVDAHTLTLDSATGNSGTGNSGTGNSGTGVVGNIGGALGSPGCAAAGVVAGNHVWLRGSFTISSQAPNVSGGLVVLNVGGVGDTSDQGVMLWQGYGSSRGDGGYATITASGVSNCTLIAAANSGFYLRFKNLILDGANNPGVLGLFGQYIGAWNYVENCRFFRMTAGGVIGINSVYRCEFGHCSGYSAVDFAGRVLETVVHHQSGGECGIVARGGAVSDCQAHNCNVPGFGLDSGGTIWNCRSALCGGGFRSYGYPRPDIAYNCVGWGTGTGRGAYFGNKDGYDNMALGHYSPGADTGDTSKVIVLTVDPFVDSAGGDLRLTSASAKSLYARGFNIPSEWLSSPLGGAARGVLAGGD